jgi:hypothetical protein
MTQEGRQDDRDDGHTGMVEDMALIVMFTLYYLGLLEFSDHPATRSRQRSGLFLLSSAIQRMSSNDHRRHVLKHALLIDPATAFTMHHVEP